MVVGAGQGGGVQYWGVAVWAQQKSQQGADSEGMLYHLLLIAQWHGVIKANQQGGC